MHKKNTLVISPYFFFRLLSLILWLNSIVLRIKKYIFILYRAYFCNQYFNQILQLIEYNLWQVSNCHSSQGLFWNKVIKFQHANLGTANLSTISTDLHLYIFRSEMFSTEINMLNWCRVTQKNGNFWKTQQKFKKSKKKKLLTEIEPLQLAF